MSVRGEGGGADVHAENRIRNDAEDSILSDIVDDFEETGNEGKLKRRIDGEGWEEESR